MKYIHFPWEITRMMALHFVLFGHSIFWQKMLYSKQIIYRSLHSKGALTYSLWICGYSLKITSVYTILSYNLVCSQIGSSLNKFLVVYMFLRIAGFWGYDKRQFNLDNCISILTCKSILFSFYNCSRILSPGYTFWLLNCMYTHTLSLSLSLSLTHTHTQMYI
jgi:hypothetical protein